MIKKIWTTKQFDTNNSVLALRLSTGSAPRSIVLVHLVREIKKYTSTHTNNGSKEQTSGKSKEI